MLKNKNDDTPVTVPLVKVNCAKCGSFNSNIVIRSIDYEEAGPGEYEVSQCSDCGFTYTSIRPDDKVLFRDFYPDDYICYGTEKNGSLAARINEFRTEGQLRQRLAFLKKHIHIKPDMHLIEIGCATGKFLTRCKENLKLDVLGIEPNSRLASILQHRGINIINTVFEKTKLSEKSFHIACLFHVLEHVWDSISTLKNVNRILKNNGYLFLELPNNNTPGRKFFGKYWFNYHLPRHLSHFDHHTLESALQDSGFEIIALQYELRPTINALSIQYFIYDYIKNKWLRKLFSANNPLILFFGIVFEIVISFIGRRATMLVLAHKRNNIYNSKSLSKKKRIN